MSDPLVVELFVSGCPSCDGAVALVEKALTRFGPRVKLEVHDVGQDEDVPSRYGVLATPAVVVGGRVKVESCTADRVERAVEKQLAG
jgi:hypothetical protein